MIHWKKYEPEPQIDAINAERETPLRIRQNKYLNNIIEEDHRAIKQIIRPMMGFEDFRCSRIILSGVEVIHMIRKGQMKNDVDDRTAAAHLLTGDISNPIYMGKCSACHSYRDRTLLFGLLIQPPLPT
ncbi:hypothetical protein BN2475_990009 [Paraburkholderia ribeironis]|uniref:DDE domain-containing protein n=1 Tax=Paraburkholderia ribeironis TaxID=1247936 RepID=A0A1N7SN69_9BURK|nr:hypothetical protein BN2475_990009 [Paraburkholderia ribeironis]